MGDGRVGNSTMSETMTSNGSAPSTAPGVAPDIAATSPPSFLASKSKRVVIEQLVETVELIL